MNTNLTQEEKQMLINRYLSGESVNTITDDVSIARSTFYSWVKTYKDNLNKPIAINVREFNGLKRKVGRLNRIITILQTADCTATSPLQDRLHEIEKLSSEYNVNTLCESLKVAKGTYYNHIFRNKRDKSQFRFNKERPHATLKYKTPDKYEAEFCLKHYNYSHNKYRHTRFATNE